MSLIAISAEQPDLEASFASRFGRAPYFILVNPEDNSWEALDNRDNATGPNAGIRTARQLAQERVQVVISGRVGPNAATVLRSAGIQVIEQEFSTVSQALAGYLKLASGKGSQ